MSAVGSLGFLGEYTPRLDEKGRLILPAKFRPAFAAGLIMTSGQERCLYVYTLAAFEQQFAQMRPGSYNQRETRDFQRLFLSAAHEETPDRQGRISVPTKLRAYAGLERDVAVIGVGTHVEIWNAQAWADYLAASVDAYASRSTDQPT